MMDKPIVQPYVKIEPRIYAYTTPGVTYHDGWIKIGETRTQTVAERIYQQIHTAGIKAQHEWDELAFYDDGRDFHDHDFHAFLTKYHNVVREPDTEWFQTTPVVSHDLFNKFKAHDYDGVQIGEETSDYTLRDEQADAVDKAFAYFCSGDEPTEYLWNAKPRFGKTLAAYDFIRKVDAQNVLIVTNRPSIANSWFDDFQKFIAWQTKYRFVSDSDSLKDRKTLSREDFKNELMNDEDLRQIFFVSLQDLKGSVYFGGQHKKYKWIRDLDWDALIVDEAHEGVDTSKTDTAFDQIKRKFTLHLSGTPFKALAMNKFEEKQIYNWTYADEQEAKANWNKEERNPYEDLPRLNMYSYQLSPMIEQQVRRGLELDDGENVDYAFDLNEFFKTKNDGKFEHEADVKKFLDALTHNEKYPFSTPELREELKHTFWLLERVDSCKALARMLKQHDVFKDYEIVLAAGDGKLETEDNEKSQKSYDKVIKAIAEHDKTITLSVGQLTTGVTVKPWTGVLMLSNMKSPAEYMQAAFRAQNPYTWIKDGQMYMKTNAYVFDFAPERTLIVYDQFANDLSKKSGGDKTREDNIKRLLNFFPVIGEDKEGTMAELDVNDILTIPRYIKAKEVVQRGFMSNLLFQNISNVFGAPGVVREILNKVEPAKEQGKKPKTTMADAETVPVDENGDVKVDQNLIEQKTEQLFGPKIYETVEMPKVEDIVETREVPFENAYVQKTVESIINVVQPKVSENVKQEYGLTEKNADKVVANIQKDVTKEIERKAIDYRIGVNEAKAEYEDEIRNTTSLAVITEAKERYDAKVEEEKQKLQAAVDTTKQEILQQMPKQIVEQFEKQKEEVKKRDVETDVRDHLRGFTRTIPSFLMAYGDKDLTLANFDSYVDAQVFKEVTSITMDEFKFLRDGGDYQDEETGETKHFEGHLFDKDVFNESVQQFLELKIKLADYFDESHAEDIFDYIPPQKTNQIYTPKRVVKQMVDALEQEDPHVFEDPNKTFADLYMKSGLYITELVKRLYNNEKMRTAIPDDHARLKHILENQVFGFAPTEIIYRIALSFIFGFDESAADISQRNFIQEDTLPYAKAGTMQELLNEKFGDRVK